MSTPEKLFFTVGLLTALGCGSCVVTGSGPWQAFAVWMAGGLAGAVMMYLAMTTGSAP